MEFLNIAGHLEVFQLLLKTLERKLDKLGENIVHLEKQQERTVIVVEHTHSVITELEEKMDKVCDNVAELTKKSHHTGEQFEACAKSFYQVRDACHVLREDLGEACGRLVTESWLDEDRLLT